VRRSIEDVSTIHLGPKAAAMERRQPGSSDRGNINRGIERTGLTALWRCPLDHLTRYTIHDFSPFARLCGGP
jgi:hypothetical protein